MAKKKNEMSPEDKLMRVIYGNKHKNEVAQETMLFIHALDRSKELAPMVEMLSATPHFPNDKYREVFQWALMKAAQWQYEKLMKNILGVYDVTTHVTNQTMVVSLSPVMLNDAFHEGDKVKVAIIKED